MNNVFLVLFFLTSLMLSGCVTQTPAPIDYRNNDSYSEKTVKSIAIEEDITSTQLNMQNKNFGNLEGDLNEAAAMYQSQDIITPGAKQPITHMIDTSKNDNNYILPLQGKIITKFNEMTKSGKSNGIDIAAASGTKVLSIAAGDVAYVGHDEKFGNVVIVKLDNDNLYVAYAYIQDSPLTKGVKVKQSDIIGYVAVSSQPKLHLAIREGKIAVDPLKYIDN